MPVITFMPSGRSVTVEPGVPLLEACRRAGFAMSAPCGGKGLCGKCRVKVLSGDVPADDRQHACLPARLVRDGWRASCVVGEYGDLTLADPADNQAGGVILTDFMAKEPDIASGVWRKDLVLAAPSTADQTDDLSRLAAALDNDAGDGRRDIPLPLLAALPGLLRANSFSCRAVGLGRRLLSLSAPSAPSGEGACALLGLAVDVGTTTLAAALCNLENGDVLALSSRANPQALHGDDVITRMEYAARGPAELSEMRMLIVAAIEEMCEETRRAAGAEDMPVLVTVGANAAMNHLLLGVPPSAMALSPFIPAFKGPVEVSGSEIGWRGPAAPVFHIVPNISAYVGGDITAGLLAHDVAALDGVTLFLDVGTNGEIALAVDGVVSACATAAGPAFEGARISQGMRAMPGAVSRVSLSKRGDLELGIVDALPIAAGICGTGLLDAVAVMLESGVLEASGRILDQDEAKEHNPGVKPWILAMLHEDDDGPAFWLQRPAGRGSHGVRLTQRDVREFQLAKGAVAAGVKVLLRASAIEAEQVDRVMLAGGFGNYLDPGSAIAVGLLPAGIGREKVKSVGNASLAGARLCLLSERERGAAADLSRGVRYIELSGRADFQEAFAEEMLFPDAFE